MSLRSLTIRSWTVGGRWRPCTVTDFLRYIEVLYNRKQYDSAVGYLTPRKGYRNMRRAA